MLQDLRPFACRFSRQILFGDLIAADVINFKRKKSSIDIKWCHSEYYLLAQFAAVD